jgi:hypothetical protein
MHHPQANQVRSPQLAQHATGRSPSHHHQSAISQTIRSGSAVRWSRHWGWRAFRIMYRRVPSRFPIDRSGLVMTDLDLLVRTEAEQSQRRAVEQWTAAPAPRNERSDRDAGSDPQVWSNAIRPISTPRCFWAPMDRLLALVVSECRRNEGYTGKSGVLRLEDAPCNRNPLRQKLFSRAGHVTSAGFVQSACRLLVARFNQFEIVWTL